MLDRLVAETKSVFKLQVPAVDEAALQSFSNEYINTGCVEERMILISSESKRKSMRVHKMRLVACQADQNKSGEKKAIIYLMKNSDYAANALLEMRRLFGNVPHAVKQAEAKYDVDVFCMDYLGRGFNRAEDNYADYTAIDDATVVKDLILHLLDEENGYKPNNITIVGDTYGANIWLIFLQQQANDVKLASICNSMTFICLRAIGLPLNSSNPLLMALNKDDGYRALQKAGWLPPVPFHEIAAKLENIVAIHVRDDVVIEEKVSITYGLKQNNRQDKVWIMQPVNKENAHDELWDQLNSPMIPGLTVFHLIYAAVTKKPIEIDLIFAHFEGRDGYPLRAAGAAELKEVDIVKLPDCLLTARTAKKTAMAADHGYFTHSSTFVSALMQKIHAFSIEQSELAINYGANYKKGMFGRGHSVLDKLRNVMDILFCLSTDFATANAKFDELKRDQTGPHRVSSNRLIEIFNDLTTWMEQWKYVVHFNQQIAGVPQALQPRDSLNATL